jgi:hypothetical protein
MITFDCRKSYYGKRHKPQYYALTPEALREIDDTIEGEYVLEWIEIVVPSWVSFHISRLCIVFDNPVDLGVFSLLYPEDRRNSFRVRWWD